MKIPTSYKKIKISQLQTIGRIVNSTTYEEKIDQNNALLSYLTGKPVSYFESIPAWKLQVYFRRIAFLFDPSPKLPVKKYIWIGWRLYRLLNDVEQFSTSRYLSIKHYVSNGGTASNLSRIIAMMYKPVLSFGKKDVEGNYLDESLDVIEARAIAIMSKSAHSVYGAVFFYSRTWKTLKPLLQIYLAEANQKITDRLNEMRSHITTGGTTS